MIIHLIRGVPWSVILLSCLLEMHLEIVLEIDHPAVSRTSKYSALAPALPGVPHPWIIPHRSARRAPAHPCSLLATRDDERDADDPSAGDLGPVRKNRDLTGTSQV